MSVAAVCAARVVLPKAAARMGHVEVCGECPTFCTCRFLFRTWAGDTARVGIANIGFICSVLLTAPDRIANA